MVRSLVTRGFLLRRRAFGESDRIVTLLTEDHGKITGIAKGARNSRRRFGGTLEPFVHLRIQFRPGKGTSGLAFLEGCELIAALRGITGNLERLAAGSYVLELVDRMVIGREAGRGVYALLAEALAVLDAGPPSEEMLRAFELKLLAASGYAVDLSRCRGCGSPADALARAYLSTGRGGIVCRNCVRAGEPVRPVTAATAASLARLAVLPLRAAASATIAPEARPEGAAVLASLIEPALSGPLYSRAFLDKLAGPGSR